MNKSTLYIDSIGIELLLKVFLGNQNCLGFLTYIANYQVKHLIVRASFINARIYIVFDRRCVVDAGDCHRFL